MSLAVRTGETLPDIKLLTARIESTFSADAEAESVFKMATILFGPNAPLTDALSGVMSKFNAQIQAENEYSDSVYDVINTMASELAGDYTTTSK
jgi:hypothetical protein